MPTQSGASLKKLGRQIADPWAGLREAVNVIDPRFGKSVGDLAPNGLAHAFAADDQMPQCGGL